MHVVLVHGSYMGAWCWDRVTPELERLGHRVTAVDLPVNDPDAGAAAYAGAVIARVDWRTRPVLVGHSMSGLVLPLIAMERPVRRLVFVAAMLPQPGLSATEQRAAESIDAPAPATAEWQDLGDGVWMVGRNTARQLFWHDAPAATAAWAAARLRPQAYRVMTEISPLAAWPTVPSEYIACLDDHAVDPGWQRRAARERLGVEAVEIGGGHSPMLTRPVELAGILDRLVRGATATG